MKSEMALKIVLGLSVAGMLFSGYLSYSELFGKTCAIGGCSTVVGIPACVYGFIMYLIVFVVSYLGLQNK
ncbi:Uncharacterised protein [uncultured archaeon]|nr:Uncharacterised protein [uncultured archaeon]